MSTIKSALVGFMAFAVISPAVGQSAPATMAYHTVYGRLGAAPGDTGPGQAIPFSAFAPYSGLCATSGTFPYWNGTAYACGKLIITQPASNATLAIAAGKTATINKTLTFGGVDGTTLTFQGTDTYVGRATTDTLTNKTLSGDAISGGTIDNAPIGATTPSTGKFTNLQYSGTLTGPGSLPSNITGFISGLQPLKLTGSVIGLNPGAWANSSGTATYSSGAAVLTADAQSSTVNFSSTPATGGQLSGALTAVANSTDGTEVFLYLIHRNSDSKVALITSSSDTFGSSQTYTATAAAPAVFTVGSPHGFRKRMAVYLSSSSALNTPFVSATQYYVCTVPSTTTFTLATSIANVNAGTCITGTGTGTGTLTAKWGVQNDIDFSLGASIATVDRRVPYFAYVWNFTKYGPSAGIPNFQVSQGASHATLSSADSGGAYTALSAGTSTTFADVDLSAWLSNLNRNVTVLASCNSPTTLGGCFLLTKGSGGAGLQVGAPAVTTIPTVGQYNLQTDSATVIQYKVTGGAQLTLYVVGWDFVDPS